ncbi:MAG: DUF1826 domain-containing protein [Pseudomonadota bacterium]
MGRPCWCGGKKQNCRDIITHGSAIRVRNGRIIAAILAIDRVTIRVEGINDNACAKFHRDTVRARLICTDDGPGTEYDIARPKTTPTQILAVPTGCPILLTGKAWPVSSVSAQFQAMELLHRSPPISTLPIKRFVVVIDEGATASR